MLCFPKVKYQFIRDSIVQLFLYFKFISKIQFGLKCILLTIFRSTNAFKKVLAFNVFKYLIRSKIQCVLRALMHISGIDGSRHVPHDHNSFGISSQTIEIQSRDVFCCISCLRIN